MNIRDTAQASILQYVTRDIHSTTGSQHADTVVHSGSIAGTPGKDILSGTSMMEVISEGSDEERTVDIHYQPIKKWYSRPI